MDFICERYGCLPSAIDAEDAYLHRMIATLAASGRFAPPESSAGAGGAAPEPEAGSAADLASLMDTLPAASSAETLV